MVFPDDTSKCPSCDLNVSSDAIKCKSCNAWFHYFCSGLPVWHIVLLKKSTTSFTCESCVVARFPNDFVQELTSVQLAIDELSNLRSGNLLIIDVISSNETESANPTIADGPSANSQVTPVTTPQSADHSVTVKAVCNFHLQGRCKHGRFGAHCKDSHPKLCRQFIRKGEKGCRHGDSCEFLHPKLCVKSLQDNVCPRKRCFLYHVTGSTRPNLSNQVGSIPDAGSLRLQRNAKPKATQLSDRPVNLISSYADAVRAPSPPVSTPPLAPTPPLMSLNAPCPGGAFASHPHVLPTIAPSAPLQMPGTTPGQISFLDQLTEIRAQIQWILQLITAGQMMQPAAQAHIWSPPQFKPYIPSQVAPPNRW